MIRLMKSRRGASSILVILLLVVLVVFGVAALTTALSNVRLGQKVQDWNGKYYAAEALANERFAKIDQAIAQGMCLSSGTPAGNIEKSVDALDFDVDTVRTDHRLIFTYEAWAQNIGLRAALALDLETMSLCPAQWKEIQKQ